MSNDLTDRTMVYFVIAHAGVAMQEGHRRLVAEGLLPADSTPIGFYGFSHFDVVEVHNTRRSEVGCWFRLRDGRVIDWRGEEQELRERELYDRKN